MFSPASFIKSLVVLIILIGGLVVITKYVGPVQEQAGKVLGVQIKPKTSVSVPEKLQQDVSESLNDVKEQGMKINLQDVVSYASRTQKIISDYQHAQRDLQKAVDGFFVSHKATESGQAKKQ